MSRDSAIVILAAGKGTRLKSERAKVLHEAGGLPLLAYVLRATQPLRLPTFVVVGHQAAEVAPIARAYGARTVLQRPQLGTGHALRVALEKLPRGLRHVLVVPGDAPLLRASTLRALLEAHPHAEAAATVLTANLKNPQGYGRILRGPDGGVDAIVEQNALLPAQSALREVNSGVYCFAREEVRAPLSRLSRNNPHGEYYLTDVVGLLRTAGEKVLPFVAEDSDEILGANAPAELARVDQILRRRKAEELMSRGVTLYQPDTIAIDPDVEVGPDTILEAGVQLLGRTRLGQRCHIGAFSILRDTVAAADVTVKPHCLILSSRLGPGVAVGPFAHLRDAADIRRGARIGNYVEVKKSVVGEGTKALHLTYLGDATIGKNTNVGAGTITCNYDGVAKNPTTIGDDVFIGSGTELVAPVKVRRGAYVAAGSTVTEDVPPDALAVARARQVNKLGWARKRREALATAKETPEGGRGARVVRANARPAGRAAAATKRARRRRRAARRRSARKRRR
ncbi:MAG: bifunctional UDP-N-acetylglucosamine diphosphorylase/glucosamine-1-phosphate N-acetyltransferase GlmU [Acidobacteria bacterium]|nr:bifunctional UDP-N-acetylglucosamine diphosphorylase/glucosamine-1-phosphate N-acetyltransferase GlmU [Acidobacteriota bacterium]